MPLDIDSVIIGRVWSLLRDNCTAKPFDGNSGALQIDTAEDWTARENAIGNAAQFPNVRVWHAGGETRRMVNLFSYEGEYPIPGTTDVEIRAVFERAQDAAVYPLESQVMAALLASGPLLGFARLIAAPIEWRKTRKREKLLGGWRTAVRWNARVAWELYPSELAAETYEE